MHRDRDPLPLVLWWLLASLMLSLSACGGGGPGAQEPDQPRPAVRLEIDPGALLLTQAGERRALAAKAYDAQGNEVPARVTWSSSNAGVLAVASTGEATAQATVGSAQVVARMGDLQATAVVVVARSVPGAVTVGDSDVLRIDAVDADATFGVGYRYVVTLAGTVPPALGAILLGRETLPVGGRVVAVDAGAQSTRVTLEVLPLGRLFTDLRIRETFRLADLPAEISTTVADYFDVTPLGGGRYAFRQKADRPIRLAARPRALRAGRAAEREFKVGPMNCTAEGGLADFELESSKIEVDTSALRFEFEWERGDRRLLLVGEPTFKFEFKPVFVAGLTGEVECKLTFLTIPLPAPSIVGALVGASVPIGAGFGVEGALPVGGVGFESGAEYGYDIRAGVACNPDCSLAHEFTRSSTASSFKWIEPSLPTGVKLEAEATAFAFADIHVGARAFGRLASRVFGVRAADLKLVTSKAALVLQGKLASEQTQAADPAFAAAYELAFKFAFGTGDDLQDALDALEILVTELELSFPKPLGGSPTPTKLTTDRGSFRVGDTVTFTVDLSGTDFPLFGYNVESVRVYRKEDSGEGTSLILAAEVPATAGQTRFELPWVATVEGEVVQGSGPAARHGFVAFVKTRLLPTRIELGPPTVEDTGTRWFSGTITEERRDLRPGRSDVLRAVWSARVSTTRPEDLSGEEASGSVDYLDRYESWGESHIDGTTFCRKTTVTLSGQLTIVSYDGLADGDPATGFFRAVGSVSGTRVDHEGCARRPGTEAVAPFTVAIQSLAGSASDVRPGVTRNDTGRVTALEWGVTQTSGQTSVSVSGRLALEP